MRKPRSSEPRLQRAAAGRLRAGLRPALGLAVGAAMAALLAQGGEAQAANAPISLDLPVDCTPGRTCWISKFVDLDPGEGVRDYMCNGRANDGHTGVDIALRDRKAMEEGVRVLAAAPGVVKGTRDGMRDVSVRKDGRESLNGLDCGNGIAIAHDGGWVTQYCHMRRGSIRVRSGEQVERGQELGLVGMSGNTEYPHVHVAVRHKGKLFDPFLGLDGRPPASAGCGLGKVPLWTAAALEALAYTPVAIYNVGFSTTPPKAEDMRSGRFRGTDLPGDAPAILLWAEIFGVEAGDELRLRLVAPDGTVIVDHKKTLEKRKARWFQYAGRKRRGAAWPEGTYRAEVSLARNTGGKTVHVSVTRELEVR